MLCMKLTYLSPRYRYRRRPCFQANAPDGRYPGLLQYVPVLFSFADVTDTLRSPVQGIDRYQG